MYRCMISRMRLSENLGWCKPYVSEDNRVAFTLNEGEIDKMRLDSGDRKMSIEKPDSDEIHLAAMILSCNDERAITDYYDSDMDYIMHRCSEVGCTYCPFKKDCVNVREHIVYCIYVTQMEVTASDLNIRYIPDEVSSEDLYKVYKKKGCHDFERGGLSPKFVGAYETYREAHRAAKIIYDVTAKTQRKDPLLVSDVVVVESFNTDTNLPDNEIVNTFIHGYKKVYPDEGEEEA